MDPIDQALQRLREPAYTHVDHLVVTHDGAVTAAHTLGRRPLDQPADVFSITKSVLATAVLLAVHDHAIGLDTTLADLLGHRTPPARGHARVRDLLTMTSGAHCAGPDAIDPIIELPGGWVDALLAEPQQHPPGTAFRYDNGAAHLLAAALHAAVDDLPTFATTKLFQPAGITDWHWPRDPDGIPWGFGGLQLSTLDVSRLANAWRTDAWGLGDLLTTATTARTAGGPPEHLSYGWMFWTDRIAGHNAFLAAGWAGQYALVVPATRLTIVVTGSPERLHPDNGSPLEVVRALAADLA